MSLQHVLTALGNAGLTVQSSVQVKLAGRTLYSAKEVELDVSGIINLVKTVIDAAETEEEEPVPEGTVRVSLEGEQKDVEQFNMVVDMAIKLSNIINHVLAEHEESGTPAAPSAEGGTEAQPAQA